MVDSSFSSSSFSHRCRLRWLYDRPSPSVSVGVVGVDGVAGVEVGVAHGLSSPWSGLNSPPRSLHKNQAVTFRSAVLTGIFFFLSILSVIVPNATHRMSKKGDWDSPGKESITAAEGRDPDKDVPA